MNKYKQCQSCGYPLKRDVKGGINGFLSWLLTRGIPRLERWKN